MGLSDRLAKIFRKPDTPKKPETHAFNQDKKVRENLSVSDNPAKIDKSSETAFIFPEIYKCRTCGKIFSSEEELENHHKDQYEISSQDPKQEIESLASNDGGKKIDSHVVFLQQEHLEKQKNLDIQEPEEGFLCNSCGRTFSTEYELQNHVHRSGDLLAALRSIPISRKISKSKHGIDTEFINKHEVNVTNLGNESLRFDHFPGKLGYIRKKEK